MDQTDLLGTFSRPASSLKGLDSLLPSQMLLALRDTASTVPGARLVANEVVIDVGVMTHLMPAAIATVAKDDLVLSRAESARAHLAQGLLRGSLAVVLSLLGGGIAR